MAKPPEARCPGVRTKIAEVEELDAHGDCWCKCVADDVPKAKELASKGFCMGAMKVIKAARQRCSTKAERGEFEPPPPIKPVTIEPIKPMKLGEVMIVPTSTEREM